MTSIFKCMLATDADLDKLTFPLLASAKLDGVRAVVRDGIVYSRSNKPIPNKHVQARFQAYEHFDGELIFGDPCSKSCYRDTVSVVMSFDKPADRIGFFVFDHIERMNERYIHRMPTAKKFNLQEGVFAHEQKLCNSLEDVLGYEEECLADGYEGLILRDPNAPYKTGRSTVNEGYLLKLKRFCDDECIIIGFEERMHNGNEATTNELGRTKRSSHKAGKTGRGDLGALVCRLGDVEFNIGTGFTDDERARIWADRDKYLGRLAKFKYFPVGVKEAPRHPVWLGLRDRRDV